MKTIEKAILLCFSRPVSAQDTRPFSLVEQYTDGECWMGCTPKFRCDRSILEMVETGWLEMSPTKTYGESSFRLTPLGREQNCRRAYAVELVAAYEAADYEEALKAA